MSRSGIPQRMTILCGWLTVIVVICSCWQAAAQQADLRRPGSEAASLGWVSDPAAPALATDAPPAPLPRKPPDIDAVPDLYPPRIEAGEKQAPDTPDATPRLPVRVELLPIPRDLGPGTEATLSLLLLGADGLPVAGQVPQVSLERGQVLEVLEPAPGLYAVRIQTPAVLQPETLGLTVLLPHPTGSLRQRFVVPVSPVDAAAIELQVEKPQVLIGVDRQVRFTVRGVNPRGRPMLLSELSLRSSMGQVEQLRQVAPGVVQGVFVPEDRSSPHVALLAATLGEGEQLRVAWAALPHVSRVNIPVETEVGARVTAEVGDKTYGPLTVGPAGGLKIPVQITPGVQRMLLRVTDRVGNVSVSSVDLSIPRAPRALLFLDREVTRLDAGEPVRVFALVTEPSGAPTALTQNALKVPGGILENPVQLGPGLFTSRYTPPAVPGRHELSLELPEDGAASSRYAVSLEVREGQPGRVSLELRPKRLRVDDPPAEVLLRVFDRRGNPSSSVEAGIEVSLGEATPFHRIGPGEFVAAYRAPRSLPSVPGQGDGEISGADDGGVPVEVRAWVERRPDDGPTTALRIRGTGRVVAYGTSHTFRVQTLNRWGSPVAGVPLTVRLEAGAGTLEPPVSTDDRGEATVTYTAGTLPGPVRIAVAVEGRPEVRQEAFLLEAPTPLPSFVAHAAAPDAVAGEVGPESLNALSANAAFVLLSGRVKAIDISAIPNVLYINTRQISSLRVTIRDQDGNPIVDPGLKLEASAGMVSRPRLIQPGNYYVAEYVPPPLLGPESRARVTVTNETREYVGTTEIELIPSVGNLLGTVRLGVVSNFGDLTSPLLEFQAGLRQRWLDERVFLSLGGAYYFYELGDVNLDLVPLTLQATYRLPLGRWSASFGLGPSALLLLGQRRMSGADPAEWQGGWSVQQGVAGRISMELGIGAGGFSLDLGLSLFPGAEIPSLGVHLVSNLGGLSLSGGYIAQF